MGRKKNTYSGVKKKEGFRDADHTPPKKFKEYPLLQRELVVFETVNLDRVPFPLGVVGYF